MQPDKKKTAHTLYVIRGLLNVKLYSGRDQAQQYKKLYSDEGEGVEFN